MMATVLIQGSRTAPHLAELLEGRLLIPWGHPDAGLTDGEQNSTNASYADGLGAQSSAACEWAGRHWLTEVRSVGPAPSGERVSSGIPLPGRLLRGAASEPGDDAVPI